MKKKIKLSEYTILVFNFLKKIPKGNIITYKDLARHFNIRNPRNIGWILRQNTRPNEIPCYKVIRSDGYLSKGYKFGGEKEQKKRLSAEGVKFDERGKLKILE